MSIPALYFHRVRTDPFSIFSSYPSKRVIKDKEGQEMGVVGSVDLLQNVNLSTQPVSSLDWSPDKVKLTDFDWCLF